MPVFALGEMGDVGRRLGTVMMFTAVGTLCGPPISGAIFRASGGFNTVSYYAGMSLTLNRLQWDRREIVTLQVVLSWLRLF